MSEIIERIKNGTRPTQILKEWRMANPGVSNHQLSEKFYDETADLSGEAIQAIWYWKDGRPGGLEDEKLDEILMASMKEAGIL